MRRPYAWPGLGVGAGSITVASGATQVNGGGTKFVDQGVTAGDLVFRASDFTFLNSVNSVQSNTQLTLSIGGAGRHDRRRLRDHPRHPVGARS